MFVSIIKECRLSLKPGSDSTDNHMLFQRQNHVITSTLLFFNETWLKMCDQDNKQKRDGLDREVREKGLNSALLHHCHTFIWCNKQRSTSTHTWEKSHKENKKMRKIRPMQASIQLPRRHLLSYASFLIHPVILPHLAFAQVTIKMGGWIFKMH